MTSRKRINIQICMGSSCFARGNSEVLKEITELSDRSELSDNVDIQVSGALCSEKCECGPNVVINGKKHNCVSSDSIVTLVRQYIQN